jgi:hypothetical protein
VTFAFDRVADARASGAAPGVVAGVGLAYWSVRDAALP